MENATIVLMDEKTNNSNHEPSWTYTGTQPTYNEVSTTATSYAKQQGNTQVVEWSASEYIAHDKSLNWYAAMLGGGIAIVGVIYLITDDWFASMAVLVALVVLSVFANRKPRTKQYILDNNGIMVDDVLHNYAAFRSFSVVEEGVIDSIWLKPLKRFAPLVVMYFDPQEEERIISTLSNYLPNEPRQLDFIDQLSKRAKF